MAARNGGKISRTLQVLLQINDSLKEIRSELGEHRKLLVEHGKLLMEHGELLAEHGGLLGEIIRAVNRVDARIDNLLVGPHRDEHQDLKNRVERLERHLGLDG